LDLPTTARWRFDPCGLLLRNELYLCHSSPLGRIELLGGAEREKRMERALRIL
jgi:hypothetical protein